MFLLVSLYEPTVPKPLTVSAPVFFYCVVEKEQFILVPKIYRCYKKYVSNELFSKTGRFCAGSVLCEKLRSLLCHEDKSP